MIEKVMQHTRKFLNMASKRVPESSKIDKQRSPKIDAKKEADARTVRGGRPVGRAAPSNILNISRRLVFVF